MIAALALLSSAALVAAEMASGTEDAPRRRLRPLMFNTTRGNTAGTTAQPPPPRTMSPPSETPPAAAEEETDFHLMDPFPSPFAVNVPMVPIRHDTPLAAAGGQLLPAERTTGGVPLASQAPPQGPVPASYPRTQTLFPSAGRLKYAFDGPELQDRAAQWRSGDTALKRFRHEADFNPVNQNDPLWRMQNLGEDVRQLRYDDRARQTQALSHAYTTDKMNDVQLPQFATGNNKLGGGLRHDGTAVFMPTMDPVGVQLEDVNRPGPATTQAKGSEARFAVFRANPNNLGDKDGRVGGAARLNQTQPIASVYDAGLPTQREQTGETDFIAPAAIPTGYIAGLRADHSPAEYLEREDISTFHMGPANAASGTEPYTDKLYHQYSEAEQAQLRAYQRSLNRNTQPGPAQAATTRGQVARSAQTFKSEIATPMAVGGANSRANAYVNGTHQMRERKIPSFVGQFTPRVSARGQIGAVQTSHANPTGNRATYISPAVFRTALRA